MNANTNLAIAQGLVQNGVKMKAELMATGYGQRCSTSRPRRSRPDVVFTQGWTPVELKTKATKQFQADLKKYSNFTGVPDFGIYTGYIDCDLAITGLKQQGKDLDQTTYVGRTRKLGKSTRRTSAARPSTSASRPIGKPTPTTVQLRDVREERQVRRPQAQGRRGPSGPGSWSASRSRRTPPPRPRRPDRTHC